MNPVEIEEAVSQLALEPFDRDEFPLSFLRAFGNPETTIKRLRTGSTNQSDIGGVLQRSNIHIATCCAGDVETTLALLRDSPKTANAKAKFILATDGDSFQAEDRSSGETVACDYADFPNHFGFFLPLAGITTVAQIRESSFDIRATGRLNKLYVELLKDNPDWAKADRRTDMNHFMARLIFCFFAEDTDIFVGEGLFTKTVEQMSARDSSDTHTVISEIFRSMDTKIADRQTAGIARYANLFPYVNGQLFSGSTEAPRFTKIARSYLNHIGNLNWKKINPDIFGSMIQAVADDEERGALGMHYTSVPNILKVLNPLFLDDLRGKLEEAGNNGRKLLNLRNRMARIRVFDPACGSGNFLVISYKQMREIEAEINRRRGEPDRRSDIPLTNFRGIELRDFPAEIARLALIIAEFQSDVLHRGQQEAIAEFLPLDSDNWITCGNALKLDWISICPPSKTEVAIRLSSNDLFQTPLDQSEIDFENAGGETYICGNPPYKGGTEQSDPQKEDMKGIFADDFSAWKSFDYILGFFQKAKEYLVSDDAAVAFVSTNSICQGEQVFRFWPSYIKNGIRFSFATTSFRWSNLASKNAGVSVCIVGLQRNAKSPRIYDGMTQTVRYVSNINAYLIAYDDIYIKAETNPTNGMPPVVNGNKPADGGGLIFDADIAASLRSARPDLSDVIRPFFGAKDGTQGTRRFCIWASRVQYQELANVTPFEARFEMVKKMRAESDKPLTRAGAESPFEFQQIRQTGRERVYQIPRHSSEDRHYYPVIALPLGAIVGDGSFSFYDPPLWSIAIFASRLSLIWIATVCGKIKTDFRFSNTFGWNTFPVLKLTEQNKVDLEKCAANILIARESYFPATIAEMYDPKRTDEYPDIVRAHEENDEVLERIYIGRRFRNDTERLEKLFDLYTKVTAKKAAA